MELRPDIEEILVKECTNQELTNSEYSVLKTWLNESIKNQKIHAQLKMAFLHPNAKSMEEMQAEVWHDLQKRTKVSTNLPDRIRMIGHFWLRIAAVFMVCISIGLIVYQIRNVEVAEQGQIGGDQLIGKMSLPGQKTTTSLPDGTVVKLNADSKILFPESFDGDTREVTLYGEAFFDVVRDEAKPFIIKTKNIRVHVLGTSFNVKSYPGNVLTVVSVASGKVAVTDSNHQSVDLLPGEKISYQSDSRSMVKEQFIWEEEYGWKDNILVFQGSNLAEIMERLSLWYGVEFMKEGEISNLDRKFSGKYTNPTLIAVLEGLSYVYDFSYEINNKTIVLNSKQKESYE